MNFKVLHAAPVQGSHGAFWLAKSSVVVHGRNREAMNAIPVNEDCVACDTDNPMFYAGLDHIHTAHINQIITELLKVDGEKK